MKNYRFLFTNAIGILLLATGIASGQSLHCSKRMIEVLAGQRFSDSYHTANRYLGPQTTSNPLARLKIYVTTKADVIYLHSNYKPVSNPYTFKLAANNIDTNLKRLVEVLIEPTREPSSNGMRADMMMNGATFFLEQKVLSHPLYSELEFPVTGVKVIGSDRVARS